MHCDDVRARLYDGAPLEGEMREHVAECEGCREEFSFLDAARAARPRPPAALRERVLAAFPRRRFRWSVAAWAASVALAVMGGFAAGRAVQPPPRLQIVTVRKPVPLTDEQIAVLAVALHSAYREYVDIEFEGTACTKIRARKEINRWRQYCPLVREMGRVRAERPDLIELH